MTRSQVTIDGNEAAAYIAFKTNEVATIYPITPSSPMAELGDQWVSAGFRNIWGGKPLIQEMQSEAGAAGALHGSVQTGSLTTTFTASQGLLLMVPNMFKIAGELTSTVFHITARTIATHALSIFGDHSDVMATRQTGWGMLFSNSVQEVMDFALIAQAATLESRVPFLHSFDGFRTSHEVMKIEKLNDADIRAMIDDELVRQHRYRALSPEHPVMRGTAQNPDVFFQAREACNSFYAAVPAIVQSAMDKFASVVGRQYHLFDYVGAEDAERVVVLMGSGCEAAEEGVRHLVEKGEKVGLIKVRLFRPFALDYLMKALPRTVKSIAVLDRTKEPGSCGEPLYQDILTAISECVSDGSAPFSQMPKIVGGRYGLSSKEFTPAMVKAVLDNLSNAMPRNHFTIGINDDVTHTSLEYDRSLNTESDDVVRCVFWGLGSDGTVGANKNSIKIIGEETSNYAQGYFVYDSKKSGGVTISHLRFGPRPIHSTYLVQSANFIGIHQFGFLERYPVLENAANGATILLNSPFGPGEVWNELPRPVQETIIKKKLKLFVIDAYPVAREANMGVRINTIMQTCFFALSGVLPRDEAIAQIKYAIKKTYGKRGEAVVEQNNAAVDAALAHMHEVEIPSTATSQMDLPPIVSPKAPEYVQRFTAEIIANRGDDLPVSSMSVDGTFPTATTMWEKRNVAQEAPVWDPGICIQCGKCVLVCPHAVIRSKVVPADALEGAPETFKSTPAKFREFPGERFILQVSVEDCTGCGLCVIGCPAKNKSQAGLKAINMAPQRPLRETESQNWEFFLGLPEVDRTKGDISFNSVKNVQLLQPLFEFSGACAGCGETPYVKLVSQLFGERAIVANATGCSSIYGGNLPTTPWSKTVEGRGPAWSNSLFEDNAEFGFGMRLSLNNQIAIAGQLLDELKDVVGETLVQELLNAEQLTASEISDQRKRVERLKKLLTGRSESKAKDLVSLADALVKKSVWIMGGDGWAYDIGYGGLDHVLANGLDVNILVLDTEVYSNTGGQASKSTARGAVAKFAAAGKGARKKDLARMAMNYENVYVASVAMGASDSQVVKAFQEAEAHRGTSLIIAYSHCISHGIDMSRGMGQQKLAVDSGAVMLFRYNPALIAEGKNPLQIDSRKPSIPLQDFIYTETRYKMLQRSNPEAAARLLAEAQEDVDWRYATYVEMAAAAMDGQGGVSE